MKFKIIYLTLLLAGIICLNAHAQTSQTSGDWADGSTWINGTSPGENPSTSVTIAAGTAVTSTISITMDQPGIALTVNGILVIEQSLTLLLPDQSIEIGDNGILIVLGDLSVVKSNFTISSNGYLYVADSVNVGKKNNDGEVLGEENIYFEKTPSENWPLGTEDPSLPGYQNCYVENSCELPEVISEVITASECLKCQSSLELCANVVDGELEITVPMLTDGCTDNVYYKIIDGSAAKIIPETSISVDTTIRFAYDATKSYRIVYTRKKDSEDDLPGECITPIVIHPTPSPGAITKTP